MKKQRTAGKKYRGTDKYLNTRKKYLESPSGKAAVARGNNSAAHKKAIKRYTDSGKFKLARKKYVSKNKGKVLAWGAMYRTTKLKTTPKWLTDDHLWMMEEAYHLAQLREKHTGFKWHVDHIVPLQGKTVCGLHVPWNLQVVPAVENLKKGNRFTTKSDAT